MLLPLPLDIWSFSFLFTSSQAILATKKMEKLPPLFVYIRLGTESFLKLQNVFPAHQEKFRFLSVNTESDKCLDVAVFHSFISQDTFAARSVVIHIMVRTQSHIKAAHCTKIFSTHRAIGYWVLVISNYFNLRFLLCPGLFLQGCGMSSRSESGCKCKLCCHPL